MTRAAQETKPDTIIYQFYLNNKDNTKCIVHETYANSDAAFIHINGIVSKTILQKIFDNCLIISSSDEMLRIILFPALQHLYISSCHS
jgi:hypothetical protein